VATHLRYGGITHLLLSPTVKEFCKSINIWQSYGQEYGVLFFFESRGRYHWRNYAYWLLCLVLLPAAWAAQQHSVGQQHVKPKIISSINDEIMKWKTPDTTYSHKWNYNVSIWSTFTTNSSSDFYYNRILLVGKLSAYHTLQLQFHDVIVVLVIYRLQVAACNQPPGPSILTE